MCRFFLAPGDCRRKEDKGREENCQARGCLFISCYKSVRGLYAIDLIPNRDTELRGQCSDKGFRLYFLVFPVTCMVWTPKRETGVILGTPWPRWGNLIEGQPGHEFWKDTAETQRSLLCKNWGKLSAVDTGPSLSWERIQQQHTTDQILLSLWRYLVDLTPFYSSVSS